MARTMLCPRRDITDDDVRQTAAEGCDAAAIEDPHAWTFARVERALDDILRRHGVDHDHPGRTEP